MKHFLMSFCFIPLSLAAAPGIWNKVGRATSVHPCDRTPEVKELILTASNKTCADVVPKDLLFVHKIIFNSASAPGLTSLKSTDFGGLVAVTDVQLQGEMTLADDLFYPLSRLETVVISGRKRELPELFFSKNSGVQQIVLENALSSRPPVKMFQGHALLKTIRISQNDLEALPDGFFANLPALENVSFARREKIVRADGKEIDVYKVPELGEDLFRESPKVKNIDFLPNSGKNILPLWFLGDKFPEVFFQSLSEGISELYLPRIEHFPAKWVGLQERAFCGMKALRDLDVNSDWAVDTLDWFCQDVPLYNLNINLNSTIPSKKKIRKGICYTPKLDTLKIGPRDPNRVSDELEFEHEFICPNRNLLKHLNIWGSSKAASPVMNLTAESISVVQNLLEYGEIRNVLLQNLNKVRFDQIKYLTLEANDYDTLGNKVPTLPEFNGPVVLTLDIKLPKFTFPAKYFAYLPAESRLYVRSDFAGFDPEAFRGLSNLELVDVSSKSLTDGGFGLDLFNFFVKEIKVSAPGLTTEHCIAWKRKYRDLFTCNNQGRRR